MTKVFINYAREDLKAAKRLHSALCALPDVEPWFDKSDLLGGVKWEPAIRKAIRESEVFLALLTRTSVKKRGHVKKEREIALDILEESPDGRAFIPLRLEECALPSGRVSGIHALDFFPNWKQGLAKVVSSINAVDIKVAKKEKAEPAGYRYRCGIIDFDNGLTNLRQICDRLNQIQNFFNFNLPTVTLPKTEPQNFEGVPNLFVNALPADLYDQKTEYLNVDLVSCLTRYLLAGDDEEERFWNHLSSPSEIDSTVLFISINHLYERTKQAGCTFEKGIVYNILSQLIVYFAAGLGFHDEIRGCVLDYCVDHSLMIKGLKRMRLCNECWSSMKNAELNTAVRAILADEIRV